MHILEQTLIEGHKFFTNLDTYFSTNGVGVCFKYVQWNSAKCTWEYPSEDNKIL